MGDYISRDAAIDAMRGEQIDRYCSFGKPVVLVNDVEDRIIHVPAANVAPVVRGKWKALKGIWPECSRCGHKPEWITGRNMVDKYDFTPYCPACGAKMKTVKDANVYTTHEYSPMHKAALEELYRMTDEPKKEAQP